MADQPKVSVLLQLIDKISEPVNGIKGKLDSFGAGLKALGATIAATFSAAALGAFLKGTVEDALEAEKSTQRLDVALRNLGLSYKQVGPEAEKVLDAIQRQTRFSDDDAREALTKLVTKTGDYGQSLRDLSLVADVAAYKQISMSDAAEIVGKAHQGNAKVMKEFGIEVVKGADATGLLAAKVAGFASQEGASFGGRLAILNNQWGEFKEKIGLAIIGSDRLGESTSGLTDLVLRLQGWVDRNSQSISGFVDGLVRAGEAAASLVGGGFRLLNSAIAFLATLWEQVTYAGESAGIKLRAAMGSVIQGIGELAQKANPLLKRFGLELGTGMAEAGAKMTAQANADLTVLQNNHTLKLAAIKGATVQSVEDTASGAKQVVTTTAGALTGVHVAADRSIKLLADSAKLGMAKVVTSVEQDAPKLTEQMFRLQQAVGAVAEGWVYLDGAWYQAKPGVKDAGETLKDAAARAADMAFAVADIAQQAGEGGEELARFATGIGNIADGIGRIAAGDVIGGITTGLSGITGIAQMFAGESASARAVRLALQKNSDRLEEHRRILGDLIAIQSPGARVAGIGTVLGNFADGALRPGGFGSATLSPQRASQLMGQFAAAGITGGDLDSLAKDAGITIRNPSGALLSQGLHDLWQWIQQSKLGSFGNTFGGQRQFLRDRATAFGQSATEQFQGLADLVNDPAIGSALLAGIVRDADLSTPEGRAALRDRLRGLFDAMDTLPAGSFGGLSGGQFKDTILDFLDFLGQIDQGAGSSGASAPAAGITVSTDAGDAGPSAGAGGAGGGFTLAGLGDLVDVQVATRDYVGSLVPIAQESLVVLRSMDARLAQIQAGGGVGSANAERVNEQLAVLYRLDQLAQGSAART